MKKLLPLLFILFITPAFSEKIVLKDGSIKEGKVLKRDSQQVLLKDSIGMVVNIKTSEIDFAKSDNKQAPATASREELEEWRKSHDLGTRSYVDSERVHFK